MKKLSLLIVLFLVVLLSKAQENKPNVLFIVVDDLRPELGCYGEKHIHSPSIDKLAETGITFNRAYCNVPVCGASRASVLSGIRPNRHRFLNFHSWQDKETPGVVSLPMHFKNNGYTTLSLGKVYHHEKDGKGSWSDEAWSPKGEWQGWQAYITPESYKNIVPKKGREGVYGPVFEAPEAPDHVYPDGMVADEAIRKLKQLKKANNPFFLALGFRKPHLPFSAPKKYWDLYDYNKIELPNNMAKPLDAPNECMHNFGELRQYTDVPDEGELDKDFMRKLIHGYYACISYTDAQVGKVLDELKRLELDENTIVILWGDHGWHLGEHNMWCKHCNFEKVLRSPVILRVMGKQKNVHTNALIEYVDLYPSLCELAGISKPFHLQGKSFAPLVKNPKLNWKKEVYSRWMKGETIITQSHTYTEWLDDKTGGVVARMMYDLKEDAEETVNISEKKKNKKLVKELSAKLKKHIAERDKLVIP